MFNMTLYFLTTLNISIQTIDCNNLQNSYVLRILCFGGEDDWLVGWGGGGVRNISSPLRGVLNIFQRFWWGGVPNFMVEFWNTLHPPPVHILYDRSLRKFWDGKKTINLNKIDEAQINHFYKCYLASYLRESRSFVLISSTLDTSLIALFSALCRCVRSSSKLFFKSWKFIYIKTDDV